MTWTAVYEANGAEIRFAGLVTGHEVLEAKREFFAHDFPDGARWAVCDFTGGTTFEITVADIHRIAEQDKAAVVVHHRLLEAVVAPMEAVFGMARMWQLRVDAVGPHTAVVRTRMEAFEWLRERKVALPHARVEPRPEGHIPRRDSPTPRNALRRPEE